MPWDCDPTSMRNVARHKAAVRDQVQHIKSRKTPATHVITGFVSEHVRPASILNPIMSILEANPSKLISLASKETSSPQSIIQDTPLSSKFHPQAAPYTAHPYRRLNRH